jgi:uncharacterized protein YndB with AHSA1/START domain
MTQGTHQAAIVRHSVTVPIEPAAAFELFAERFSDWWPHESHHILDAEGATGILEPRRGGRLFERAADGSEYDWGRVTACEPPGRLVIAWQLDPEWRFDPDPAKATEVEVTFEGTGDGTLVTLEHRGFEVHAGAGSRMRDSVDSSGGWPELLERYAARAA